MKKDGGVGAPAVADAVAAPIDAPGKPKKLFITGAGRCGECHEKMYDEWEVSAHAAAMTSSLYKASVADAKDASCDRCHAPLASLAPKDIVAEEGVTCDVCHTLREPSPSKDGGSFRLAVDDMVKYGPRCDLKDHYFHRMGCSKEHSQAQICGSCHWWEPRGIPVFTEYADWKAGPQAAEGTQCQDCHMPDEKAPLATGSPVRTGVPHHGLLGIASDLRARALGLELEAEAGAAGQPPNVHITIHNNNAGHAVPAGLPERRIAVTVTSRDAAGAALATQTTQLGRKLVDGAGAEVPFWRATRVASDTRIAPGSQWTTTMTAAPNAKSVDVEVVSRGLSDYIAKQLNVTDVEQHPMVHATVKLGSLPATVVVKPPAPGKRVAKKKQAPK